MKSVLRKPESQGYEPILTKTRWLLLKRPENLTDQQRYNLRSVRSYLLFQLFWQYISPYWAGKFLDKWCTKTMPKAVQRPPDWFRAKKQFSSGMLRVALFGSFCPSLCNEFKVRPAQKSRSLRTEITSSIRRTMELSTTSRPRIFMRILRTFSDKILPKPSLRITSV